METLRPDSVPLLCNFDANGWIVMSEMRLIETLSFIRPGSELADSLLERSEIMALSQASHDAVLLPRTPGGICHAERAAMAARMARSNADATLAAHYDELLDRAGGGPALLAIASGAPVSTAGVNARLQAMVRHVDLLTLTARDASRNDIAILVAAGVSEPDIVRLAELAAFVNYQVRVIAGLRLLETVE
jgi:uncharacterized protein YciW